MKTKSLSPLGTGTLVIIATILAGCQFSPSSENTSGTSTGAASDTASSAAVSETATSAQTAAADPAQTAASAPVQHMVCFKFKEDATEVQKQQHMADFAALKDSIPEVKSYSGAYTFEVSYEKTADYDCMHIAGFDSEEDLETYFHHPAHQRFIERNKDIWADVIVVNSKE